MNQPAPPPPPPLNHHSLITQLPEIPISTLISRHLSTNLESNPKRSIQDLVEQKSWKTLAEVMGKQIIQTDITQTASLLQLWSIRLECLIRLNQTRIVSNELTKFLKILHKTHQLNSANIYELIPFSILVIKARLPYLLNPTETSMNKSLNLVYELIRHCKVMILDAEEKEEWKKKLNWLNDLLISILNGNETHKPIKIDADLINELMEESNPVSKSQFWIENGDLLSVETYLTNSNELSHDESLLDVARGDWEISENKCKETLKTQEDGSLNIRFNNQLALSLLYQGKISEALEVMKSLMNSVKDISLIDSLIFNLATILELRSTTSQLDKINLLNQIKLQFSIESLHPNAFKLD